jgi:hypothetical protein
MKFSFPYEFDWDSKRNAYSAIAAGILVFYSDIKYKSICILVFTWLVAYD